MFVFYGIHSNKNSIPFEMESLAIMYLVKSQIFAPSFNSYSSLSSYKIHCLYIAHTLPIHCPHIVHILPKHYPFIGHTLVIHCPYSNHTLSIHCPYIAYTLPIHCRVSKKLASSLKIT